MTKASLEAMMRTWSTPLALSLSTFSMKEGTCLSVQVGVKAPGTAMTTTFLFLNSAGSMQLVVSFYPPVFLSLFSIPPFLVDTHRR